MEPIVLEAQKRTIQGKQNNALRRTGVIPAVIYGKHQAPIMVQLAEAIFMKAYKVAGESSLLDLVVGSDKYKVLIQSVDRDALTDRVIHADFHAVSLTEKLHATIPLTFTGEAKAVKEMGGVLVKNVDELEVECLPQDLVHSIPVDLAPLVSFDIAIRLKDIVLPPGITVRTLHDEDVIATVEEPRSEAELAALDEKPVESVEAVEMVEKKKAAEEGAEGEEAGAAAAPKEKK